MADLNVNSIGDASGGTTATVNGFTPTVSNMAGRNLIINGAMQVAQRGTTGTNSSTGYGIFTSVDRWATYYNGTRSQQLNEVINGAYTYYLKIDGNTAPVNLFFYQKIEFGSRLVSGKEVTLSFLAKSSNSTAMRIRARFYDSATQNNVSESAIGVASLTNTWTSYSYTFTPTDSSANLTRDLMLLFDCDGGAYSTGDDISITGVQLEEGSVATPFEHRQYGQELALCQRYFQVWRAGWTGVSASAGYQYSATVNFSVTQRVSPTITLTSYSTGSRFPQGNWFTTNVGAEGFTGACTANASGGNDNWLAVGTALAEL